MLIKEQLLRSIVKASLTTDQSEIWACPVTVVTINTAK